LWTSTALIRPFSAAASFASVTLASVGVQASDKRASFPAQAVPAAARAASRRYRGRNVIERAFNGFNNTGVIAADPDAETLLTRR
jgi:hypothetical protein